MKTNDIISHNVMICIYGTAIHAAFCYQNRSALNSPACFVLTALVEKSQHSALKCVAKKTILNIIGDNSIPTVKNKTKSSQCDHNICPA